jgi:hypothetical protein
MRSASVALAGSAVVGLAACGGGSSQDANEPSGTFTVDVAQASFPLSQRLAGQAEMRISVRNPGQKTIPNVAVTVDGGGGGAAPAQAFGEADKQVGLADPSRPVWIVDSGPPGGETAYVNTWALGRLDSNHEKTFVWRVTPVVAGTHTVRYRVAAGVNGKANAALGDGGAATGSFTVTISSKPAGARVDPNGNVTSSPPGSKAVPPSYPASP